MSFEYKPIYEPFDLGEIDPRFEGQSLNILRNPTRKFRREYWNLQSEEFQAAQAFVLGVPLDKVDETLDNFDQFVIRILFTMAFVDGEVIQPYIVKLWDKYSDEQVKKFYAPPAK